MPRFTADENPDAPFQVGPEIPGGDGRERHAGGPGDDQGISNRPDDDEDDFDDDDEDEDDEDADDADELNEPD